MTRISMPFLKKIIRYAITEAEYFNRFTGKNRFYFITDEVIIMRYTHLL